MAVFANEHKLRIQRRASMERCDGSDNTTLHFGAQVLTGAGSITAYYPGI
jgi:hypothetical protein